jgi:hypothetical protein
MSVRSEEGNLAMLAADQVLDQYFLESRCQLVEIAAMLDRYDRAGGEDDDRLTLLYKALDLLADRTAGDNRAEQMLNLFTDPE